VVREHLRPVTPEYLDAAPVRLVAAARLAAPPEALFRALTEDCSTWPLWFPEVTRAGYTGPPPYGPGAGRAVRLRGGAHFVESVLLWERPHRFVYRVEQVNFPGAHAWLEEWRLDPAGPGTDARYTLAFDVSRPLEWAARALRPVVVRSLQRALHGLDAFAARGEG
jgi:uncharacterized protein YndB with AHSA1/START domain